MPRRTHKRSIVCGHCRRSFRSGLAKQAHIRRAHRPEPSTPPSWRELGDDPQRYARLT